MNQLKKIILGLATIIVLAPMLSMAADPLPDCFPCPDTLVSSVR